MHRTIVIAALLVAASVAGCGDANDNPAPVDAAPGPDAAPRQIVTDTRTLGVGELIEGTLFGGPADRADLYLSATAPELDWNIHGHAGSGTQTVAEGLNQLTVEYAFTPSAAGEWFVLLRNSGAAPLEVTARIELYGAITWSGWL
ncbi:MAG: hypothetical protein IPL61_23725 [Myxococcales bacterium]|nr:hypothetical protein [Myxococcales bacterium]